MERVKIGIVGTGGWGSIHASIYEEHPLVDIVAVCDLELDKAQALAEKFNVPEVYTDYKQMAAESSCDAVAIVTPDFLHADISIAFAEKGKHLLVEKPLATTREDAFAIEEAVKRNNVRCMVDLHNRWNAPFNVAKQQLESGVLGEPYTAYIRLSDEKWVATELLPWAAESSILWFLGSHSLDAICWFFQDEVKRVYSLKRHGIMKELGVDTPDIYLTTVEFARGGIAHMENGWITPNGNGNANDFKCSVLCTKGQVSIDASSHNLIRVVTEDKAITPDILVTHRVFERYKGLSYESIRDFIDRLIDGKPFRVSLEEARNVTLAIVAMLESAEKQMPVDVRYD